MSRTRPTGDQLRFNSSVNGESVLDTYLENCEKGGRSLPDLLDEVFDSIGDLKNFIELRENPLSAGILQYRFGEYVDPEAGWGDFTTTNFNTFVTNAQLAETNAQSAQVTAGISRDNALISETNAAASAAAALVSELVVAAFNNSYLGSKTVDPTLDNDGGRLKDGDLYFNTTVNNLYVYDLGTTTWIAAGAGLVDAPSDGSSYVRQDGVWVVASGGFVGSEQSNGNTAMYVPVTDAFLPSTSGGAIAITSPFPDIPNNVMYINFTVNVRNFNSPYDYYKYHVYSERTPAPGNNEAVCHYEYRTLNELSEFTPVMNLRTARVGGFVVYYLGELADNNQSREVTITDLHVRAPAGEDAKQYQTGWTLAMESTAFPTLDLTEISLPVANPAGLLDRPNPLTANIVNRVGPGQTFETLALAFADAAKYTGSVGGTEYTYTMDIRGTLNETLFLSGGDYSHVQVTTLFTTSPPIITWDMTGLTSLIVMRNCRGPVFNMEIDIINHAHLVNADVLFTADNSVVDVNAFFINLSATGTGGKWIVFNYCTVQTEGIWGVKQSPGIPALTTSSMNHCTIQGVGQLQINGRTLAAPISFSKCIFQGVSMSFPEGVRSGVNMFACSGAMGSFSITGGASTTTSLWYVSGTILAISSCTVTQPSTGNFRLFVTNGSNLVFGLRADCRAGAVEGSTDIHLQNGSSVRGGFEGIQGVNVTKNTFNTDGTLYQGL